MFKNKMYFAVAMTGALAVISCANAAAAPMPQDVGQCFDSQASTFKDARNKAANLYADVFDNTSNFVTEQMYLFDKYGSSATQPDPSDCQSAQASACTTTNSIVALQTPWNMNNLPQNIVSCCKLYASMDPSTVTASNEYNIDKYPQFPVCAIATNQILGVDPTTGAYKFYPVSSTTSTVLAMLVQTVPAMGNCQFTACSGNEKIQISKANVVHNLLFGKNVLAAS